MRKLLFATTALIATAGVAAAQDTGVTVSGTARLGVLKPNSDAPLQFVTHVNAVFAMSTTTDAGLTFGANIELSETTLRNRTISGVTGEVDDDGNVTIDDFSTPGSGRAFDNTTQGGEEVFISGPFGTLTMGDTDGAFDWALQEAIIGSTIGDVHEHAGYTGNSGLDGTYDGQIARYEFAFGDFAAAVSAELDDNDGGDPALGIGARYSTSLNLGARPLGFGFGAGYQTIRSVSLDTLFDSDDDDEERARIYGASADVDFGGGFRGIVNYSNANEAAGDFEHVGLALGYTIDAFTVGANFGRFYNMGDDDDDAYGYGLAVNYDLGGGAQARFGYGFSDTGDDTNNAYSAGIQIAF